MEENNNNNVENNVNQADPKRAPENSYKAKKHKRLRKAHKQKLLIWAIICLLVGALFINNYYKKSQNEYNNYKESATATYKANLKENDYYREEYVDTGSIITKLIDNMDVTFNYNLDLEKEQDYEYSYKIIAKTSVKENKKSLSVYDVEDELLSKDVQSSNLKNLQISETLNIDYLAYNEKITNFVSQYKLADTTNTLTIEMHLNAINKYDGTRINKDEIVEAIDIPLTTNTISISVSADSLNNTGKILSKSSEYTSKTLLYIGSVLVLAGVILIIKLIQYIIKTRSAEAMYSQELKQIMFKYKATIQKTDKLQSEEGYRVIKISSFDEMLSLRDSLGAGIIVYTDEEELRSTFTITREGVLYKYVLGAREIREELRKENEKLKGKK